jgi:hypothetical protein
MALTRVTLEAKSEEAREQRLEVTYREDALTEQTVLMVQPDL